MFVFYILRLPWRSGEFKLTFCVVELGLTFCEVEFGKAEAQAFRG